MRRRSSTAVAVSAAFIVLASSPAAARSIGRRVGFEGEPRIGARPVHGDARDDVRVVGRPVEAVVLREPRVQGSAARDGVAGASSTRGERGADAAPAVFLLLAAALFVGLGRRAGHRA